jgi:hypothetical protein
LAILVGILFMSKGVKNYVKWVLFSISLLLLFFLSDNVLEYAEITDLNIFDSTEIQNRASSLSRATSGIDLSSYSLPVKLLSFWLRPLFFDASNLMGLIVSFENLFYLVLFYYLIVYSFLYRSELNGWFWICFFSFLLISLALSQISGNLGIALRQKAQVMPLMFIVVGKLIQIRSYFRLQKQLAIN